MAQIVFNIDKATIVLIVALSILLFMYYGYVQNQTSHLEKRNFRQLIEIGSNIEANIAANKAIKPGWNQRRIEKIVNKSAFIRRSGQIVTDPVKCDEVRKRQGEHAKSAAYYDTDSGHVFFVRKSDSPVQGSTGDGSKGAGADEEGSDGSDANGDDGEEGVRGECFFVSIRRLMEENMPANSFTKVVLADQDGNILAAVNGGAGHLEGNRWSQLLSSRENHLHFVSTGNWTGQVMSSTDDKGQLAPSHAQSSIQSTTIGSEAYRIFLQPFSPGNVQIGDGSERGKLAARLLMVGIVNERDYNAARLIPPVNLGSAIFLVAVLALPSFNLLRIVFIGERAVISGREVRLSIACFQLMAAVLMLAIMDWRVKHCLIDRYDEDMARIADDMDRNLNREIADKHRMLSGWTGQYHQAYGGRHKVPGGAVCDGDIERFGDSSPEGASDGADQDPQPTRALSPDSVGSVTGQSIRYYYYCSRTGAVPTLRTLFYLDKRGQQIGPFFDYYDQGDDFRVGINLASRVYFQRALSGELWPLRPIAVTAGAVDGVGPARFYLQRVESRNDSSKVTMLSIPMPGRDGAGLAAVETGQRTGGATAGDPLPAVAVASFQMQAFENVVLPPGMGFAVVDSKTGDIIYHSEDRRSLRENIFDAVDHDPKLKASLLTGITRTLSVNYAGESIRLRSKPLGSVPWTLLIHYDKDLLQLLNLQITFTAVWMVLVYFLTFFLFAFLAWLIIHRLFVSLKNGRSGDLSELGWLFPNRRFRAAYLLIVLILLVQCVIYANVPVGWFGENHAKPLAETDIGGLISSAELNYEQELLLQTLFYVTCTLITLLVVVSVLFVAANLRIGRRGRGYQSMLSFKAGFSLLVLLTSVFPTMFIYISTIKLYEPIVDRYTAWHVSAELEQRVNGYIDWILKRSGTGYGAMHTDLVDVLYVEPRGVYLQRECIEGAGAAESEVTAGVPQSDECQRRIRIETWSWEAAQGDVSEHSTPLIPTTVIDSLSNFIDLFQALSGKYRERCERHGECREDAGSDPTGRIIFTHDRTNRLLVFEQPKAYKVLDEIKTVEAGLHWVLLMVAGIYLIIHLFLHRLSFYRIFAVIDAKKTIEQIDQVVGFRVCVPPFLDDKRLLTSIQSYSRTVPSLCDWADRFCPLQKRSSTLADTAAVCVIASWQQTMQSRGASNSLLVRIEGLSVGDKLLFLSAVDPYHWLSSEADPPAWKSNYAADFAPDWPIYRERWGVLCADLEMLDFRVFVEVGERAAPIRASTCDRVYGDSTLDEKIVLACIAWYGYFNPANENTALSLYYRGLIDRTYGTFYIPDEGLMRLVRQRFPFKQLATTRVEYQEDRWRQFKFPLVIFTTLILAFFAYIAKDQLQSIIAILGAVAGALTTLRGVYAQLNPFAGGGDGGPAAEE